MPSLTLLRHSTARIVCCSGSLAAMRTQRMPSYAFASCSSFHASASPRRSRRITAALHLRRRQRRQGPSKSVALHHLPCTVRDLDDTSLSTLGVLDHHPPALEEMLKRHIMYVDRVDYDTACQTFDRLEVVNHQYEYYMAAPFQIAIVACGAGAFLAFPLVFDLTTVEFVNEHFVTAEHPQPKELETALEVGSWSWNWMEPVLGTSTFVLLCLQYMRIHLNHLGVHPLTYHMKRARARNLVRAFPRYNSDLLTSYSQASPFFNPKDLWWK